MCGLLGLEYRYIFIVGLPSLGNGLDRLAWKFIWRMICAFDDFASAKSFFGVFGVGTFLAFFAFRLDEHAIQGRYLILASTKTMIFVQDIPERRTYRVMDI